MQTQLPQERFTYAALWCFCTDAQQEKIQNDFLDSSGLDLVVQIEDGTLDKATARKAWHEFRDARIDDLCDSGKIQLPE
jgi:hypothetical protein